MKKFISIALSLAMVFTCAFGFAGCAKKADAYELVMITDGATITDGGYNQSAWNGVKAYADENNMSCRYYQPMNLDDENATSTVKNYIDLAVKNGAKFIILPGEKFAVPCAELAGEYADINFILVDAVPHTADDETALTLANVMTIDFDLLEAGFLAGYASVSLGNTKLGYFGSVADEDSSLYGAGYVEGASYAADESATPVLLDYAEYDADNLNYDYSFTIRPVYQKVSDSKEKTFKVTVVDGIGSGVYTDGENVTITANPAPEGKEFDHWECKSDTKGVRDGKVNISSKSKTSMNLLVGDCDCTITAIWKDAKTYPVTIGDTVINAKENTDVKVSAPSADSGMVFDHWETSNENEISDVNSADITVAVTDHAIDLTPVYVESDIPTFDVVVENGTGSGSYHSGDYVEIVADAPQDGYMFYKWENVDNQGLSTGIAMENEFCYATNFSMVDRYSSIAESMFDNGTQVIFGGGNSQSDSIFTATWNYDYQAYGFGAGVDQNSWGNCLASVVNDYGAAIKLAIQYFNGGSNITGSCENGCIYTTNIPEDNDGYAKVYDAIASGKLTLASPNGDVRTVANSKCLTLNYWIK